MSNTLAIAASGLKAEEYHIDRIANDLANLNTSNYKASTVTFEDVLYQNINGEEPLFNNQANAKLGLGTAVYKTGKDFSKGPLKASTNDKDVAIDGDGFYQVINSDGNIAYTRNSSLKLDEDHYLATQDGLRLADNIQIPDDQAKLTIKSNGDVEVLLPDESEPQLIGTIQLAKFTNPETLNPIGSGLYTVTDHTSEPLIDNPSSSGLGALIQYQTEGSNVDMVSSLMQLTMAQRVYQLNAKAVQIADELEKITNEIRG
ncbi:flagellar hook-basal body protein [Legionella saoudiensis]|uniref:flagellar hook-basal body protein n=1 Tax=Legionella saoudiensis TaxID=1750561 RepID=UPI0007308BB0|nr:flagellar hook-basal body complex protein [Legionella saoudiensis]